MKHVVIAIPAYTWTVYIPTVRSLFTDLVTLVGRGDRFSIYDELGSGDLSATRAGIMAKFLAGEGTHLVSIDHDVCWEPGALLTLVDAGVDLVAGVYPKREDPITFPVRYLDREELHRDPETGLLEVAAVQGGFTCYSRACLERMRDAYAETMTSKSSRYPFGETVDVFDPIKVDGRKLGEDFAFCQRWRAIGGRIWVEPEIKMAHIGNKAFSGSFGAWLRSR